MTRINKAFFTFLLAAILAIPAIAAADIAPVQFHFGSVVAPVTSTAEYSDFIYIGGSRGTFGYQVNATNCAIAVDVLGGVSPITTTYELLGDSVTDYRLLDGFSSTSGPSSDGDKVWYPEIYIPNIPYLMFKVTPLAVTGTGSWSVDWMHYKETNK